MLKFKEWNFISYGIYEIRCVFINTTWNNLLKLSFKRGLLKQSSGKPEKLNSFKENINMIDAEIIQLSLSLDANDESNEPKINTTTEKKICELLTETS